MNRDPDDDLRVLRRMLPVPAERDFPPGRRHQHEEHLMTSWLHLSRRPAPPRIAVRIATAVAVAAAAAGAFAVLDPSASTTVAGHGAGTSSHSSTTAPAGGLPSHIGTVAYTLDHGTGDAVRITVHPDATADAAGLQRDLAAMGVRAHVTKGWHPKHDSVAIVYNLARHDRKGDFVATLHRKEISRYPEVIVFSLTGNDPSALTITVDGN